MKKWQGLPPRDILAAMERLQEEGAEPPDPPSRLLFLEYLKQAPLDHRIINWATCGSSLKIKGASQFLAASLGRGGIALADGQIRVYRDALWEGSGLPLSAGLVAEMGALSPDGQHLAVADGDGRSEFFANILEGGPTPSGPSCIDGKGPLFSPDATFWVLVAGGRMRCFTAGARKARWNARVVGNAASLAISSDGAQMAVAFQDGTLELRRTSDGQLVRRLECDERQSQTFPPRLRYAPQGTLLMGVRNCRFFILSDDDLWEGPPIQDLLDLVMGADGGGLLALTSSSLETFSFTGSHLRAPFRGGVRLSPDGCTLAKRGEGGIDLLINRGRQWRLVRTLPIEASDLAFGADSLTIVTRDPQGLQLWAAGANSDLGSALYGRARRRLEEEGKSADPTWNFLAILAEICLLEDEVPQRHREFSNAFRTLSTQPLIAATRALTESSRRGDSDATAALVRAAMEARSEQFSSFCRALEEANAPAAAVQSFLRLYRDAPEFAERLQSVFKYFAPPTPLDPPPSLPVNKPVTAPRLRIPPAETTESGGPPWSLEKIARPFSPRPANDRGYLGMFAAYPYNEQRLHVVLYEVGRSSVVRTPYNGGPNGWRYSSYQAPEGRYTGGGDTRHMQACQISCDLRNLLVQFSDGSVEILEGDSGSVLARRPEWPWARFAVSPDRTRLVVGGPSGLYTTATDLSLPPFQLVAEPVLSFVFTPSGRELLVLCKDGALFSLCGTSRRPLGSLVVGDCSAFSPDSRWLANCQEYGQVQLVDTSTGTRSATFFSGLLKPRVTFSLDSQSVVLWDSKTIQVWSTTGKGPLNFHPYQLGLLTPPSNPFPSPQGAVERSQWGQHDRFFEGRG